MSKYTWHKRTAYSRERMRQYSIMIGDDVAVSVRCQRLVEAKLPWKIEISGWSVPNYRFTWPERFNEKKLMERIETMIEQHNPPLHEVIFNRIFEMPREHI
jgi:hypothetical protein